MSDIIRPISFKKLINWIPEEYRNNGSIFGIPESNFFKKTSKSHLRLFGETCETPIGPAAGPHTQLTQNIIAAYLCGGRFFELKTVQELDNLKIEKPCIEALDEGYNTEWSTELTVSQAYDEYLKAWMILNLFSKFFNLSNSEGRRFIFNMSVGYDLAGIQTEKIDVFIEGLKDASKFKFFNEYKSILKEKIKNFNHVKKVFTESELRNYIEDISPHVSNSITLSTMHGCPPDEIEAICKHLIREKHLHTFVKLNPTLLGYEYVKDIFDKMGFGYIQFRKESFTRDLQFNDALRMIERLKKFARDHNREFGIKLSNTLPVINQKSILPGEEMYMSGRPLFPLTINLASRLASEFDGDIHISYSGGASFFNIDRIYETGIKPITLATDLLKPGGYLRLKQLAEKLESRINKYNTGKIDIAKLQQLAQSTLIGKHYFKRKKVSENYKIDRVLPLIDCAIAPCVENCPIKQDVPEYIRLIHERKFEDAFKLIISKNPLPHITGYICGHKCMLKCTRWHYDDPLLIRDLKRIAAENGYQSYIKKFHKDNIKIGIKVAIIGAGPSGLSAGYFLAKAGFDATIFDKNDKPGGTVRYVIPNFRIPRWAIENDIHLVREMGVKFELGVDENFSIGRLKEEGYKYIYLAIGAGKSNSLEIIGDIDNICDSIEFLSQFNKDVDGFNLGRKVAVIGGGNSAMDSARAAVIIKGVENVYIIYRRTEEFMPADKEEFENALADGVIFRELLSPVEFFQNGILKCQKMRLGEIDSSGRRRPIPIENEFEEIKVDSVISAIGESVDSDILLKNGVILNNNGKINVIPGTNETSIRNVFVGGDALRGPSTVIESIADGSRAASVIISRENIRLEKNFSLSDKESDEEIINRVTVKKGIIQPVERRILQSHEIGRETNRCLECNLICNRCVEVCPNRANIAVKIKHDLFRDIYQIIHIDGLCNECGNCETFCPYQGAPYKDKLTLFWNEEDFNNSENNGFILESDSCEPEFKLRLSSEIYSIRYNKNGKILSEIKSEDHDDLLKVANIIRVVYKDYKYIF